jgi:hypothetical protein
MAETLLGESFSRRFVAAQGWAPSSVVACRRRANHKLIVGADPASRSTRPAQETVGVNSESADTKWTSPR